MSTTSLYAQVPKEQLAVEMQSLAVQVKETDACDSTKANFLFGLDLCLRHS